ncbi:MAG: hypothetical protein M9932_02435 [Xanthobacteraceae bacterium]|nr:hypothetical protein [Xanthobacteraceae bacterium]
MFAALSCGLAPGATVAQEQGVGSLKEMFARLKSCWRARRLPSGSPGMEITVRVAFTRDGRILGRPRVTFETRDASDDERLVYRVAVMETLQRCVPMPFIHGMGDAVAGRPLTLKFDDRRNSLKPTEKRAWLTTTTL